MAKKSKAAKKKRAKARLAADGQKKEAPKKKTPPAKAAPLVKKSPPANGPGLAEKVASGPGQWWSKGAQFFREVKVELKKVTWPSRKETLASTSVVVALVLLAAVFLGVIDLGLSRLIRTIIG